MKELIFELHGPVLLWAHVAFSLFTSLPLVDGMSGKGGLDR
jgi:hypothetical protein